ncbi:MAG: TlpA disulfide reductase family protein [Campylobacterota bacterium]|nr:TlpA disulfide reductase family protein [Campylobacterota bacterium]
MKIKNITILSILTITLLTGCDSKESIDENMLADKKMEKTVQKQQTPTFNLTTTSGKEIKIEALRDGWKFNGLEGKVVLLDFFGTWCPPCKAEIPHLNNIREKLKNDFEILGIDIGPRSGGVNSPEHLAQFIKEFSIKYPITVAADNGKLFGTVSELNPQGSIPFMVLFNKKGEYLKHYIGMKPEEMLFSDVKKAIEMK